ncbi:MAG: SDR family oxidoreductase [Xanthomonadales bacterium PRO6]|nr:Oxidoreductase UcpA [Xanthomonadales bacterium]MCE7930491.1 SDR family oxidoreductase [Xanthomonadales bacterium PRO6]
MRDPLFDLTGKTALVTGASRGIGEAIARLLAAHGAHVIVSSRKQEACEAVVAAIRADGGSAQALAAHIGDPAAIDALFAQLDERGLHVGLLVNNAAANPYFGPMLDMGLDAFHKTVDVNIRGYWYMTQQAAKRMPGGGAIVNIASVNGRRPAFGQGVYSFSKAAIISMTEAWAKELAGQQIRVNAVLPGLTDTRFASALTSSPAIMKMMLSLIPQQRVAQPAEIAPAVLYLLSPASAYVTGVALPVDGGYLA